MATAQTIINRAFRLCKVLDSFQAASSEDAADALSVLNGLLAELHCAEVGIPDYSFAALATEIASDAADAEALAYMLARRVAPEYGVELSSLIAKEAHDAESRLRLRYFQPGQTDYCELPSTQDGSFNFSTGE
jgi:hypothetical protein